MPRMKEYRAFAFFSPPNFETFLKIKLKQRVS